MRLCRLLCWQRTRTATMGIEAAVGPHSDCPLVRSEPAPPFHAGSGRRRGRCWPGPRAAGTSARRRFRRRWPAAGDSPGRRCMHPPWPVRGRSSNPAMVKSRAFQAMASNSRLGPVCPHRKLRQERYPRAPCPGCRLSRRWIGVVNAVAGAPMPPASSSCRRCWLGLGPGPGPRDGQHGAGPGELAREGSARHC